MFSGITFKARIKRGAIVHQDFRVYRWPKASPPAKDADMVFTGEIAGLCFELKAPGYGGKPYVNGGLGVYKLDDMVIDPADHARIIAHLTAQKQKEINEATSRLVKLTGEMSALTASKGTT